jgi:hypothetical protein
MKNFRSINRLVFPVFIAFSGLCYAGLKDFNLADYKLPDLDRKSLETNSQLYGGNSKSQIYPYSQDSSLVEANYRYSFYLSGNLNTYQNTPEFQKESYLYITASIYNSTYKKDDKLDTKYLSTSPSGYYHLENRRYFHKHFFFEFGYLLDYQYSRSKDYFSDQNNSGYLKIQDQKHTVNTNLPLKFGIGRIEQVQDARHAIYLFDELAKIKRIAPAKTDKEIIEFAEQISRLKNKRVLDYRLKRMNDIVTLDSFLIAKNYVLKSDAPYFTTLDDFWAYGNGPVRYSGTRLSGVIIPGYYQYNNHHTTNRDYIVNTKYNFSAFVLNGGFELKHEVPMNLLWQNSIQLNCYAGFINGKIYDKPNADTNMSIQNTNLQTGFSHTIGFFPNTRTSMTFQYEAEYLHLFDKSKPINALQSLDGEAFRASANLSIRYYISPRFTINFSTDTRYLWQDSKNNKTIQSEYNYYNMFFMKNFTYNNNSNYPYTPKYFSNHFSLSLSYSIF